MKTRAAIVMLMLGLALACLWPDLRVNAQPTHANPDLVRAVSQMHPELRLPNAGDLSGAWTVKRGQVDLPFACSGDFNGDGRVDFAAILLGEQRWHLKAFLAKTDGGYASIPLKGFPGSNRAFTTEYPAQDFRLECLAPGEKLDLGQGQFEDSPHDLTTIVFRRAGEAGSAIVYGFSVEFGLFGVSRYGDFID